MCGPIVMNFARTPALVALYQLGRMASYVAVGALLGAFGDVLWNQDQATWIAGLSLATISVLLILNGYRTLRGEALHFHLPATVQRVLNSAVKIGRLDRLPPPATSLLAGVFTVLLPCGHLYSFFLGAVASGSSFRGAAFMFAFWLGSTPLLSFGSVWLRRRIAKSPAHAQKWAGVLLVAAGLFSVLTFGARTFEQYQARSMGQDVPSSIQAPRCH
jgi:uncharacterized protein